MRECVHLMRILLNQIENYHRLHALLSQLKIAVLDAEKKEAKQKYQEALQSYVIQYFGRPLEKLNVKLILINLIVISCFNSVFNIFTAIF